MKNLFSLLCNAMIVLSTAYAVCASVRVKDGRGAVRFSAGTFRYFTTDSNVLAALAALAVIPFNLIALSAGRFDLPAWAMMFKYTGAVAVAVTFLTVLCFLGPTQGYREMFAGTGLYMHLIGPLLAAISFGLLETGHDISIPQSLAGLLPVLVYGAVYAVMAVGIGENNGGWEDFYGFNRRGAWPVSAAAMLAGTYIVCAALRRLHNAA